MTILKYSDKYDKRFNLQIKMLKEQVISKGFNKKSTRANQILFTKVTKDSMMIKILVLDEAAGQGLISNQLDELAEVFQLSIANNRQNITILRLLKGLSGIQKYLSCPEHWNFEINSRNFQLTNSSGKTIFQLASTKSSKFDVFDLKDIINILRDFEISEIQTKYLLNRAFQIICHEKEGTKFITKEQVMSKKKKCLESAQKSKKKLNHKQNELCKYIRTDSYNFDSFGINGVCITKQYENIQRCLFGCISIRKQNEFTIKIDKISKQNRDPVIWIGVVDSNYLKSQCISDITNVFAMSDQKKIRYCSQLNKTKKITPKNRNGQFNKLAEFQSGDIIKVSVNQEEGVICWMNSKKEQLGSCSSQYLKMKNIEWVPFVELWKIGDAISWCI